MQTWIIFPIPIPLPADNLTLRVGQKLHYPFADREELPHFLPALPLHTPAILEFSSYIDNEGEPLCLPSSFYRLPQLRLYRSDAAQRRVSDHELRVALLDSTGSKENNAIVKMAVAIYYCIVA